MREHLGAEFGGTVSAVTSFGLFVQLDGLYVEGLVHITELGGEFYRFDEMRQELRGERSGTRYVIGSRVRVQVSRVDLDGRRIDFRLVQDGDAASALRARRHRKADASIGAGKGEGDELSMLKRADRAVKSAARSAGKRVAGKAGRKPGAVKSMRGKAAVPRGAGKAARRK